MGSENISEKRPCFGFQQLGYTEPIKKRGDLKGNTIFATKK